MLVKVVKDLDEDAETWGHVAMNKIYFGFDSAFPLTVIILLFNFGLLLDFCILVVMQACAARARCFRSIPSTRNEWR